MPRAPEPLAVSHPIRSQPEQVAVLPDRDRRPHRAYLAKSLASCKIAPSAIASLR